MTKLRLEDCPPELREQILRKLKEQAPIAAKVTVYCVAYRVGSRWMATGFSPNFKTMYRTVKKMCCASGKAAAETIAGNPPARLVTAVVERDQVKDSDETQH